MTQPFGENDLPPREPATAEELDAEMDMVYDMLMKLVMTVQQLDGRLRAVEESCGLLNNPEFQESVKQLRNGDVTDAYFG